MRNLKGEGEVDENVIEKAREGVGGESAEDQDVEGSKKGEDIAP